MTDELALRYLLELSTDIRLALLVEDESGVIAATPDAPDERLERLARDLAREAVALGGSDGEPVEVDVTVDGGAVFLVHRSGRALICLTGAFALPGLILHDMRMVLHDLERSAAPEPGR